MIVGLTGKTCAGKDTLVPFFADRGYTVIDADLIAHRALEVKADAVTARFGTVERRVLGRQVFADRRALADLEAITQPWIAQTIRAEAESAPGSVVINAALLHKQNLFAICHVVVWVHAPLWTRILRARRRDKWGWNRIFQRIRAQRELRPQVFGPNVDILRVDNGGSLPNALRTLEARFGPVPKRIEDAYEKQ